MLFRLFTKVSCPLCPLMKELGDKLLIEGHTVICYDLDTADGLMESIMNDVMSTPSLILLDSDNNEIKGWRSIVPEFEEVMEWL